MSPAGDPFAPDLLHRLPETPRKVAVVRASRIGDFLCTIPALRALRCALPGAAITLITLPLLRELADRIPSIDRVVAFPGFPGIAEQLFTARSAVAFFAQMQAERFDLAIQLQGSGVHSNPFTLMLGARATAGFMRRGDRLGLLHAALPWPERGHEIDRMLAMTTFLGAPPRGRETDFKLRAHDIAAAEALVAGLPRPLIGVHAGARDVTRRWPPERFAEAASTLHRRYGGSILLLGDEGERELAERVAACMIAPVVNLAGRTSLLVLAALINRLALLLTNDSGPAHIAYAQGTPSVTIFGGASPDAYGPSAGPHRVIAHPVTCRPRDGSTCSSCAFELRCLSGVSVAEVARASEELLSRAVDGAGGRRSIATMPMLHTEEATSELAGV